MHCTAHNSPALQQGTVLSSYNTVQHGFDGKGCYCYGREKTGKPSPLLGPHIHGQSGNKFTVCEYNTTAADVSCETGARAGAHPPQISGIRKCRNNWSYNGIEYEGCSYFPGLGQQPICVAEGEGARDQSDDFFGWGYCSCKRLDSRILFLEKSAYDLVQVAKDTVGAIPASSPARAIVESIRQRAEALAERIVILKKSGKGNEEGNAEAAAAQTDLTALIEEASNITIDPNQAGAEVLDKFAIKNKGAFFRIGEVLSSTVDDPEGKSQAASKKKNLAIGLGVGLGAVLPILIIVITFLVIKYKR